MTAAALESAEILGAILASASGKAAIDNQDDVRARAPGLEGAQRQPGSRPPLAPTRSPTHPSTPPPRLPPPPPPTPPSPHSHSHPIPAPAPTPHRPPHPPSPHALRARPQDGSTALHHAAFSGRKDCVVALLAAGAANDIADTAGKTAGQDAEEAGHAEIVGLIQAGPSEAPASPEPAAEEAAPPEE